MIGKNGGRGDKKNNIDVSDDELSLDQLDQVVGGAAQQQEQPHSETPPEGVSHESTMAAATAHIPDHAPPAIAEIELQVEAHTLTGDQAVSRLAEIVGQSAQGAHGFQESAGAEIASLIARGSITADAAMTGIHNAVTSHTLTGEQAVGLLAGVIVEQTTYNESPTINAAARGEIAALVAGHHVTVDQAITTLAAVAGDATPSTQLNVASEILSLASQYQLPAAQIASDISGAVYSHDLPAEDAVSMLASVVSQSTDTSLAAAAGQQIATLVHDQQITPAEAMSEIAGVFGTFALTSAQAIPMFAAAVEANGDLLSTVGAELGRLVANGSLQLTALGDLDRAVTSHVISADSALMILTAIYHGVTAADPNYNRVFTGNAINAIYTEIAHLVSSGEITAVRALQDIASVAASQSLSVSDVYSLMRSSGPTGTLLDMAVAEVGALIASGNTTAAAVLAEIGAIAAAYPYPAEVALKVLSVLLPWAASGAAGAADVLTTAMDSLIASGQITGNDCVGVLSGYLDTNAVGVSNIAMSMITSLVEDGRTSAGYVIALLVSAGNYASATQLEAYGQEINVLITRGFVTAAEAAADAVAPFQNTWGGAYTATRLLAALSGANADFAAAAYEQVAAFVNAGKLSTSDFNLAISGCLRGHMLTADQAMTMMLNVASHCPTAFQAAVGTGIATLIGSGAIPVALAIADLHSAIASHVLTIGQAFSVLSGLAAGGNAIVQAAAYGEVHALVTANLVTVTQATDILHALAASTPALQNVINSELAALRGADPAQIALAGLQLYYPSAAQISALSTQLTALLASGAVSVSTIINDIHGALTARTPTMQPDTAMALLSQLGARADASTLFAVIAEMKSISDTIRYNAAGQLSSTAPQPYDVLAAAIQGHRITAEQTVQFIASHVGDPMGGNWASMLGNLVYRSVITVDQVTAAAAHLLETHSASPAAVVRMLIATPNYNASIEALIVGHVLSIADIKANPAISNFWWAGESIPVFAHIAAGGDVALRAAALEQIAALAAGADEYVVQAIRSAMDPASGSAVPLTAAQGGMVLLLMMATGNATVQAAAAGELGSLSGPQLTAALDAAVAAQTLTADQRLQTLVVMAGLGNSTAAEVLHSQIAASIASHQATPEGILATLNGLITRGVPGADAVMLSEITSFISSHQIANDAALTMLAGLAARGVAGAQDLLVSELTSFISSNQMSKDDAVALAFGQLGAGTFPLHLVTDVLTALVAAGQLSMSDVFAGIATALASASLSADQALSFFMGRMSADVQQDASVAAAMGALVTRGLLDANQVVAAFNGLSNEQRIAAYTGLCATVTDDALRGSLASAILRMTYDNPSYRDTILNEIVGIAAHGDAALQAGAGAMLGFMMTRNFTIDTSIYLRAVDQAGLTGEPALLLLCTAASLVTAERQSVILAELREMMGDGRITPAQVGAAVADGHVTTEQAIGMLAAAGPGAVLAFAEASHLAPAGVMSVINGMVTSHQIDANAAFSMVLGLAGTGADYAVAAGAEIAMLLWQGLDRQQMLWGVQPMLADPATADMGINLLVGLVGSRYSSSGFAEFQAALGGQILGAVMGGSVSIGHAVDVICNAVTLHGAPASNALSLLSWLASRVDGSGFGSEVASAGYRGLGSLVGAGVLPASQTFADLDAAANVFAPDGSVDGQKFALMLSFVTAGGPALTQAFGDWATSPERASQVISGLQYAVRVGEVTTDQALTMIASMGVAADHAYARVGGQSYFMTSTIEPAIAAMISSGLVTARHAVEVFAGLAAHGDAGMQTVAGIELAALSATSLTMAIVVAGFLGDDQISALGTQLAHQITRSELGMDVAMSTISAALAQHDLTAAQGLALLLATAHESHLERWAAVGLGSPVESVLAAIVQAGMSPADVVNGITGAIATNALNAEQAVVLLGFAATQPNLAVGSANAIAGLVASGQISASVAISDIVGMARPANYTSGFTYDQAATVLVLVAAAPGSTVELQAAVGAAANSMTQYNFSAAQFAADIRQAIDAYSLTGAQAVQFLLPIMAQGRPTLLAAASDVLGDLIAAGSVSISVIQNAVVSNAPRNLANIDIGNTSINTTQNVVASPTLTADQAVIAYAQLTEHGNPAIQNAALAAISNLIAGGQISTADAVADIRAAVFPPGVAHAGGLSGAEAVAVLAAIGGSDARDLIGQIAASHKASGAEVIAAIASVAADLVPPATDGLFALMRYVSYADSSHYLSMADVANGIASAVDSHNLAPGQALSMLLALGTNFNQLPSDQAGAGHGLAALIANGHLTAAQVTAGIDQAIRANTLSVATAFYEMAGALQGLEGKPGLAQLHTAVVGEIAALIAAGQVTAAQAVTFIDNAIEPTFATMRMASELSATEGAALLVDLCVATNTAEMRALAGTEIGRLVANGVMDAGSAVAVVHNAMTSGAVTTDQAFDILMALSGAGGASMHTAVEAEIVALVTANVLTADHAVESLAAAANQGSAAQAAVAGVLVAMIGAGQITAQAAMADLTGAVAGHHAAAEPTVAVLANLLALGSAEIKAAAAGEIASLITGGQLTGDRAVAAMLGVAHANTGLQTVVCAEIATLVAAHLVTGAQAVADILAIARTDVETYSLLAKVTSFGDLTLQIAAGQGLHQVAVGVYDTAAVVAAMHQYLTSGAVTPAQYAAMMIGLAVDGGGTAQMGIANGGTGGLGYKAGSEIGTLVNSGLIAPGDVMAAISAAVTTGGLTVDQALTLLPYIAQGSANNEVRAAALGEVCALVRDNQVSATHAVYVLLAASVKGTFYLQTTVGNEIGALIQAGLLSTEQFVDRALAFGHQLEAAGDQLVMQHVVGMLTGVAGLGSIVALDAAAAVIVKLIAEYSHNGQASGGDFYVTQPIIDAIAAHRIGAGNGVSLLLHCGLAAEPYMQAYIDRALVSLIGSGAATAEGVAGMLMSASSAGPLAYQQMAGTHIEFLMKQTGAAQAWPNPLVQSLQYMIDYGPLSPEQALALLPHLYIGNPGWEASYNQIAVNLVINGKASADHVIETLANVAAHGDAALQIAIGREIAALFQSSPATHVTATQVAADIGQAVTSGVLTPEQAMTTFGAAAHFFPSGPNMNATYVAIHTAIGAEIGALIAQHAMTVDQAMNAIVALQGNGRIGLDDSALMIAGIWAHPSSTADVKASVLTTLAQLSGDSSANAVAIANAIHTSAANQGITAAQAIGVLTGVSVYGSVAEQAALRSAAGNEIAALIAAGLTTADQALATLEAIANQGSPALQFAIGVEIETAIARHAMTAAQAIASIEALVTSHAMTADRAITILAGMTLPGDSATRSAVVAEINKLIGNGTISAAQVLVDVAAASNTDDVIAVSAVMMQFGSSALQTAVTAEIGTLLSQGTISVGQLIGDIAAMVSTNQLSIGQSIPVLVGLADANFPGLADAIGRHLATTVPLNMDYSRPTFSWSDPQLSSIIGSAQELVASGRLSPDHMIQMLMNYAAFVPPTPHNASNTAYQVRYYDAIAPVTAAIEALVTQNRDTAAQMLSSVGGELGINNAIVQSIFKNCMNWCVNNHTITPSGAIDVLLDLIAANTINVNAGIDMLVTSNPGHDLAVGIGAAFAGMVESGLITADTALSVSMNLPTLNQRVNVMCGLGIEGDAGIRASVVHYLMMQVVTPPSGTMPTAIPYWIAHAANGDRVTTSEAVALLADVFLALPDDAPLAWRSSSFGANGYYTFAVFSTAQAVITDSISALIKDGSLTAAQAVAVITGEAASENTAAQDELGTVIAGLVTRGAMTTLQAAHEIGVAFTSQTLTYNQMMTFIASLASDSAVVQRDIGRELVNMIAAPDSQITLAQVIASLDSAVASHDLSANLAIGVLTGFVGTPYQAAAESEMVTLAVAQLGLTPNSPLYADMVAGITFATSQFAAAATGMISGADLVSEIESYASSHNIPAEALLGTLLIELQGWSDGGVAANLTLTTQTSITAIAGELLGRLNGMEQTDLARLVATGVVSQQVAEQIVSVAAAAMWPVVPHPATTSWQQTVTMSLDVLHVNIQVEENVALVNSGQMTAEQAFQDLLTAAGSNPFAAELGLCELAQRTGNNDVMLLVASHFMLGTAETSVVQAIIAGWLSNENALALIELAGTVSGMPNVTAADGSVVLGADQFRNLALAQLDMRAIDLGAAGTSTFLESNPVRLTSILAGCGAMIAAEPGGTAAVQHDYQFSRHVWAAHMTMIDPGHSTPEESSKKTATIWQSGWDKFQKFTEFGQNLGSIITHPDNVKSYYDMAVGIAAVGVPMVGVLAGIAGVVGATTAATGLGYLGGSVGAGAGSLQAGGGLAFAIANYGSKGMCMLLEAQGGSDASGVSAGLHTQFKIISLLCDTINGTVSAVAHAAADAVWAYAAKSLNAYQDLLDLDGKSDGEKAKAVFETIGTLYCQVLGLDMNATGAVFKDAGLVIACICTGNFDQLDEEGTRFGLSILNALRQSQGGFLAEAFANNIGDELNKRVASGFSDFWDWYTSPEKVQRDREAAERLIGLGEDIHDGWHSVFG